MYSPYDGHTYQQLEVTNWDIYSGTPSEYEQPVDVTKRLVRFIKRVRKQHEGEHIVAVTHADPFAFTVLWARNTPVTIAGRKRPVIKTLKLLRCYLNDIAAVKVPQSLVNSHAICCGHGSCEI